MYQFTIDRSRRLVRIAISAGVGPDDVTSTFGAILEHPDYAAGYGFLLDRRELSLPPRPESVRSFAEYWREHAARLGPCRMALITSPGTGVWVWRTTTALLTQYTRVDFEVFENDDEAEAWVSGDDRGDEL